MPTRRILPALVFVALAGALLINGCGGGSSQTPGASAPPPTASPTVPSGLTASSIATGSITISWDAASEPNGPGIGGYDVYRDGVQIATVSGATRYTDSPLTALTAYSYQVAAFDTASPSNVSALSATLSVTTLPDTRAPAVPSGLTASAGASAAISLSWDASTDLPNPGATGVGGYYVYRNGTQIASVAGVSFTDPSAAASTAYSYQVAAFDRATPANVSARSNSASVNLPPLAITPRLAALTLRQTQQFGVNAPVGTTLSWSVDGVAGGNSSVGTISPTGLYTAPAAAGTHRVVATSPTNVAYTASVMAAVTDLSAITGYHYDLARTGQNLQEYALTPGVVSGGGFGKLWSCPLDGTVYAQPLYVANLSIGGQTHNVLFVVTMHDTVYAFDADNPGCVTYWTRSLINPAAGVTSISSASAPCGDTPGEFGISGTPVIDPVAQTLYLVASTTENGSYFQRLHALQLQNGQERPNSPAVIQASVAGTGDGGSTVTFNALYENQRPGLVLYQGGVIIGWASHCDSAAWPWHGWLMRYDSTSLAQTAVFNTTPNGTSGGIWMSGGAPAVDSGGNLFFSIGNGVFDNDNDTLPALAPNDDFGESFLNLNSTTLVPQDFYTPSQNAAWSQSDLDIASSGVMVLPDGAGPPGHPNLFVGSDKQAHLWMIDRSSMSGYVPNADNTVQYLGMSAGAVYSTPAYWNGSIYVGTAYGPVMAFQLSGGLVPTGSNGTAAATSRSAETYGYPGATPAISASPAGGAIVWTLDTNANGTGSNEDTAPLGPAVLRAYDANNLASTLFSSAARAADTAGNASKFMPPVVANGHVYVAGAGSLTVYGPIP